MYNFNKMRKNFFHTLKWAVLSLYSMLYASLSSQEPDPVLKFYVSQADSTFEKSTLSRQSIKYSFEAATYFKSIGRGGAVKNIDSSIVRYFCNGTTLDSHVTQLQANHHLPEITFIYPNVFEESFEHKFFPNDIGGEDLAIGFSNDSTSDHLPDGIAVLDREEFNLKNLYMYFPDPEGYKRLTRSFRFSQFSGFTFPDSIWEVGAKQGIFSTEYYRLETKISNIQLLR